jgi:hypothetical protein
MSIPHTFAADGGLTVPASYLDDNFAYCLGLIPALTYPPGTYTFATTQTISGPVAILPGTTFVIQTGVVLTFSGAFSAPLTTVFTGGGSVVFADGTVDEVHPQWWGFSASATAAVNDAARLAALNSITTRGVVRFPPGSFNVNNYVPINRSYIKFVGASQFGTTFVPSAGAGDITGIDGTQQPGYVFNSSPLINYCEHLDISVYRADSQTATGTSGIPTGSRGFVHQYAVNSKVDALLANSPIDYYQKWTSGVRVRLDTSRGPLTGDSSATIRYGFVNDCSAAPPTAVGVNDDNQSCYRWHRDYISPSFVGTNSWGALDYGNYMTDHFIENIETAGGLHAWDVLVPSGSGTIWDYHVARCVLDVWGASSGAGSGLRLSGFPASACFDLVDGYSTPGFANASLLPSVWINGCTGVIIQDTFEAKGGANYANHVCYQLTAASSRCIIKGRATGFSTGCLINGASTMNTVSIDCMSQSGQSPAQAVSIAATGTNRNRVTGCTVDGAANYTYAFLIDGNAQYNTIGPNNVNPGVITTNVININATAITTTKSGSAWVDSVTNNNRVLPGTLDDGL